MSKQDQIIIDGVNIFDTLDNWADLISQEWCSGEYPVAEIIKNYILDINKQLARKTQECDNWKYQAELGSETTDRLSKQLEEKIQECEELKSESFTREKLITLQEEDIDRYRKALEEIETVTKINCEEICGRKFTDCKDTSCFSVNILDIINKAKGEGNV